MKRYVADKISNLRAYYTYHELGLMFGVSDSVILSIIQANRVPLESYKTIFNNMHRLGKGD